MFPEITCDAPGTQIQIWSFECCWYSLWESDIQRKKCWFTAYFRILVLIWEDQGRKGSHAGAGCSGRENEIYLFLTKNSGAGFFLTNSISNFRSLNRDWNQKSLQIWPMIKNICSLFPGWILQVYFYHFTIYFCSWFFTKFVQVDGGGSLDNNPSASITPGNYLQVKSLFCPRTKYWK